jgi:hypothetical protein
MSDREKLSGIVRSVLREASGEETDADRAKGLAVTLGMVFLYKFGLPILGIYTAGLVGSILSDANVTRTFNRVERMRADQRDGTLTLLVKNKSRYKLRVKELYGGYYMTTASGPGSSAASSIMGENQGTYDVKKFFSDLPHEEAIPLKVEQMVPAGNDQTLDVAVESKPDIMTIPFRLGATISALKSAAEKGDFGPLKQDSPEYKRQLELAKSKNGGVDRDLGDAPFVAAHARVLVYDENTANDAMFYMPVGFNRLMQHTIVLDDKLANKALRKQEKIVRKLKPGEDLPGFGVD